MGMKRERTVVEVSDEQAQNEFKKLMREKTMAEKNMSDEQKRQEELVSCLLLCTNTSYYSSSSFSFSYGQSCSN